MILHWPQIFMLFWIACEIAYATFLHGKPREGKHSVGAAIFAYGLIAFVLYAGGFWEPSPITVYLTPSTSCCTSN